MDEPRAVDWLLFPEKGGGAARVWGDAQDLPNSSQETDTAFSQVGDRTREIAARAAQAGSLGLSDGPGCASGLWGCCAGDGTDGHLRIFCRGEDYGDRGYEKPQAVCFLVLLPWMGEATQPVPVPLIPAMAHTPAIPGRRTTPCHSSAAMGTGAVLRVSCSLSHGQGRVGQGHGHRAVPQGGSEEF